MNIVDVIIRETRNFRDRAALVDGQIEVTFGQLVELVHETADALRKLGIVPGQRLGFLCEDGMDYIVYSLGVLAAEAVLVPIDPSTSSDELTEILDRIDVHGLIFDTDRFSDQDGAVLLPSPGPCRTMSLAKRKATHPDPPGYADLHPAFIRFSSGTTGQSKGVLLSHRAILERTDAADVALKMSSNDRVAWLLSMSFHFVVTILLFLRRGATIVMCSRQFPDELLSALKHHEISFIYASPFHYQMMTQSIAFAKHRFSNVRMAISTAMKMPHDGIQRFEHKFDLSLSEAYGIIEVGLPAINLPDAEDFVPNSVGRPLPDYDVKIHQPDEHGVGEVFVRGKGLFDAYYAPWQRRETCLKEGYFPTGDLGRLDREGRLHLLGRDKDLINFAGMKIFPQEVEFVLNQHDLVVESLVYGIPHSAYGEMPVAKLVLCTKKESAIDEIRRFCYQRLASYKVPKQFEVVDQLERTQSGKIKRIRG